MNIDPTGETISAPTPAPPPRVLMNGVDTSKGGYIDWYPFSILIGVGMDAWAFTHSLSLSSWASKPDIQNIVHHDRGIAVVMLLLYAVMVAVAVLIDGLALISGYLIMMRSRRALAWTRVSLLINATLISVILYSDQGEDSLRIWLVTMFWLIYFARSERVRWHFGRRLFDRKPRPVVG